MENRGALESGELSSSSDEYTSIIGDIITEKMVCEEKILEEKAIQDESNLKEQMLREEKHMLEEQCYKRLNLLLSRSSIYSQFMADKLKRDELKEAKKKLRTEKLKEISTSHLTEQENNSVKRKRESKNSPRKKSHNALTVIDVFRKENKTSEQNKQNFGGIVNCNEKDYENGVVSYNEKDYDITEKQPLLFTGGVMHPYQIEGFEWLKVLFENGVNGILADEMGLGKTIQCIAFIAYLIEMGVSGPFFVCGPLSTVPNWYLEFKRFAPTIPTMVYHGEKFERKRLRENIAKKVRTENVFCCPVVITSYQIALYDAKILAKHKWNLLVIDEAHRIKNFQCKLVTALKTFTTSHRLLLTGTPLQNDLSELWSLLNFILPEIFDDLKVFESWFDISRLSEKNGTEEIVAKEQEKQIISIIHQILTPFLLRRTKSEVHLKLPTKKEVIVHAPLTKLQKEYYTAALNKTILKTVGDERGTYFDVNVDINSGRPKRNHTVNFADIYKQFDDVTFEDIPKEIRNMTISIKDSGSEVNKYFADIKVNIRNIAMLLRKICGHPYLLSYPFDPATGGHKIDEDLIKSSGKLLVLDVLLPELKKRGHKILLFSQFVTMLEILEEYCIYRKYPYNLLCGDMSLSDREKEMNNFRESKDSFLFLISTRAGGLGINLSEADTVIIYDSDWNPQSDLQAQDRCHRIGQKKPVVVYRLIIPNTIDEKILNIATAKRRLEKVIIKKGRFSSKNNRETSDKISIEELIELLQSSDISGFVKTDDNCVLSPAELQQILDRSDMVTEV